MLDFALTRDHGRPQGVQNGHLPLPGNWDLEPKYFLVNLKAVG